MPNFVNRLLIRSSELILLSGEEGKIEYVTDIWVGSPRFGHSSSANFLKKTNKTDSIPVLGKSTPISYNSLVGRFIVTTPHPIISLDTIIFSNQF